ncbi:MAG: ABC transporter permease [Firmicutes bacterium]|nr:ABC transporter permease [Bacillota bacterium]
MNKRLPRDLKQDMGKYIVIFLFMTLMIALVSGFLVADNSMKKAYDESFEKYNVEYGHMAFDKAPDADLIETIEYKSGVKMYDLRYKELSYNEKTAKVRIYKLRDEVNFQCLMEGKLPESEEEIALDRLFAEHQGLAMGDTFTIGGKDLAICGIVALPDYSCLFENNADMMFDATNFGVGVVTEAGYDALPKGTGSYNYAWRSDEEPADDTAEKDMSDDFLENLADVLGVYNQAIASDQIDALQDKGKKLGKDMQKELFDALTGDKEAVARAEAIQKQINDLQDVKLDETDMIDITSFVPRYANKAINFTGEDLGSDKVMFVVFDYIVTIVLAFIFAITISGTITSESGTIGTLRASGYTRGEMVRYYMTLPILVTIVAAIIGNILGYTVLKYSMADLYMASYSLTTYETLWNSEAFILTTAVPIVMMLVINLTMLISKLRLSPLRFLRHELSKRQSRLSIPLSKRIRFMNRFRLRILFQNTSAYIVLFVGIFLGGAIAVFGTMFGPLLDDYSKVVTESEIAAYQYIVNDTDVKTANKDVEKYSVTSLDTMYEGYMTDNVLIYGIKEDSKYITADIKPGEAFVNNGLLEKFKYKIGDTVTLKDPYSDDTYDFTIAGVYKYDAALSVFISREDFNETFNEPDDYFSGYFSDVELTDIDEDDIASVITEADLTRIATQLRVSMGDFFKYVKYFAIVMFILMMYVLTKNIIERNVISISMTKILGYTSREIAGLYLVITSVVVILSLLIAIPILDVTLRFVFTDYMYTMMTGYIPYIIDNSCYVKMVIMGLASYLAVCAVLMFKIGRIPKSDALKNVE